jgi:hypothetical protein
MRQCTENMLTSLTYKIADAVVMRGRGGKGLAHMSLLADGQVRALKYELLAPQGLSRMSA